MDKRKERLITSAPEALTEAAKINIAAAKEMASSAVTVFSDTVTGREKPSRILLTTAFLNRVRQMAFERAQP